MAHSSFFQSSQIAYVVFVCLLLILQLKGGVGTSSPGDAALKIKYDVFVSFRGPDVRRGFLGHLVDALSRKKIHAFVDDNIEVGDEIPKSLVGAIQASLISLVILSPNYASSHWCLEELAKIVECRENDGQFVLPVFFDVDPSDVRYQKGSYADAFVKLEERYDLVKIQRWRTALQKTANLSGLTSTKHGNDNGLLEEIIKNVKKILNHDQKYISEGLIGIGKSIALLESELNPELEDVRVFGIWGMGGLGKTTLAWEVFNSVRSQYEGSCFLRNVRENSAREGIISLKNKLYSELIGEDLKIDGSNGLPQFVEKRLGRMKVIIVLDDVSDFQQLKILFGTREHFGSSSRIIVTSRDKQVLHTEVDSTYQVKPLHFDESLRLFNLIAFKQKQHLEMEFHEQSKKVIEYAKGIPLVLQVLGHHLHGKRKEIWESLLEKLKSMPSKEVHDVMKLSYDDLDRDEKKIFLDIASFFKGLNLEENDVKLLLKDQGSETIRSITTKLLLLKKLQLSPHVFSKMSKLQFLDFYSKGPCYLPHDGGSLYLPEGLESFPDELRFLRWAYYPMEALPAQFSAENLIVLSLPNSRVKKLWHQEQNLGSLRMIGLQCSTQLTELPDFSNATNVKVIDLRSSSKLIHIHPSVFSLEKLTDLDLSNCISLTSLTSDTHHLRSLRYLSLHGCTALMEFSVTSMNMVSLNLDHTGIKQLPPLFGNQRKLEKLSLVNSTIECLPESIKHLLRLRSLDLRHCRELQTLPELPPNIEKLNVQGCISLKTVLFPVTAAEQMKEERKKVSFWNCLALDKHTLEAIGLNAQINIMKFAYQDLSRYETDGFLAHQATYVYPGSEVPEWLFYRRTNGDHITIDVPFDSIFSDQLGFIFAFIVPEVESEGLFLNFSISGGGNDADEGKSFKLRLDRPRQRIASDHVYLMYDAACSNYLNSRAKSQSQPWLEINVSVASQYTQLLLKGIGVMVGNAAQYHSFLQQMKWLGTTSDTLFDQPIYRRTRAMDSDTCEPLYQTRYPELGNFYGTRGLFPEQGHGWRGCHLCSVPTTTQS
ncbi:hypothetical protein PIB30_006275 [Stylosanthes scabra]|uniref:TIR domain-containing protein n=1 Tax=Stylosanthes scabra TaxID=79078 RepID=A0ABU6Q4D2_9FABA|nr:hypothetical protein [Stylosanthes scabra]